MGLHLTGGTSTAALNNAFASHGEYAAPVAAARDGEVLTPVVVSYLPAGVVQTATTATAYADLDATNLVVSFVCPPSGKVKIIYSASAGASTGAGVRWRLRDASAGITSTTVQAVTGSINATGVTRITACSKDGAGAALVPGKLYTFFWQHANNVNAGASAYTEYGGAANDGAATLTVEPISNRVFAKTITTAVDGAVNFQPMDLHHDDKHMIGYGITLGRIAYSADTGASWSSLPNSVTPTGTSTVFYAGDGEIVAVAGISGSSPGTLWKSSGWATNPATATFTKVLTANNEGNDNSVYFANFTGYHRHGNVIVVNEYGPKTSTSMGRYVYVSEDYGTTWRAILDLRAFVLAKVPGWDGNSAHTHGSVYDPWFDAMWVVTGDFNGTGVLPYTLVSFDWRKPNPTWNVVYTKHQFTSVIPMPGCVLFGTDTGGSAVDGIGNGLLRMRRMSPRDLTVNIEAPLEAALIFDASTSISTIGNGFRRHRHIPDAPTLIGFGESGVSGPTGRVYATYDGYTFRELWTASDTGTLGAVGPIVGPRSDGKITVTTRQSVDGYARSLATITLA